MGDCRVGIHKTTAIGWWAMPTLHEYLQSSPMALIKTENHLDRNRMINRTHGRVKEGFCKAILCEERLQLLKRVDPPKEVKNIFG